MPTLTITKNYLDTTTLTEAQLDSAFGSVTTFLNTTKLDDDNLQAAGISRSKLKTTSDVKHIGWVNNLGIILSTGSFFIKQADHNNLASTEGSQASIAFPHTTAGQAILLDITANATFIDDAGSSDIVGEEFGVTTGIAWDEDRPFYIYAVNSDNTASGVAFAISPNPAAVKSPATTNIGWHANPAATPSDNNFFFLTATDVSATHDAKPCVRIGGIRMKMSTSDDWTIQTLDEAKGDGIRSDPFVGRDFLAVEGQMGAKNILDFLTLSGAGIVPRWATPANIEYVFSLGLDGRCNLAFNTSSAGSVTNGSGGTANLGLALPYVSRSTARQESVVGRYSANASSGGDGGLIGQVIAGTSDLDFRDVAYAVIQNNDFSDVNDELTFMFSYQAFRQD